MDQSKQTAIEWLLEQCPRIETIAAANIIEEAKAMEKKQMKDMLFQKILRPFLFDFEEYYNETYGK